MGTKSKVRSPGVDPALAGFAAALAADPSDRVAAGALADWLADRGDPRETEFRAALRAGNPAGLAAGYADPPPSYGWNDTAPLSRSNPHAVRAWYGTWAGALHPFRRPVAVFHAGPRWAFDVASVRFLAITGPPERDGERVDFLFQRAYPGSGVVGLSVRPATTLEWVFPDPYGVRPRFRPGERAEIWAAAACLLPGPPHAPRPAEIRFSVTVLPA